MNVFQLNIHVNIYKIIIITYFETILYKFLMDQLLLLLKTKSSINFNINKLFLNERNSEENITMKYYYKRVFIYF